MLDVDNLRKQLEGQLQSGLESQREQLNNVNYKCNLVLKTVLKEVADLRMKLEEEKRGRRAGEENFVKCTDKLNEGLVYLTIEIAKLDMQLEKLGRQANASPVGRTKTNGEASVKLEDGEEGDDNEEGFPPQIAAAAGIEQVQEREVGEFEGRVGTPIPLSLETGQWSTYSEELIPIGNEDGNGEVAGESESSMDSDLNSDMDISEDGGSGSGSPTTASTWPSHHEVVGIENLEETSTSEEEDDAPAPAPASAAMTLEPNGVIAMALSRLPGRGQMSRIQIQPGRKETTVPVPGPGSILNVAHGYGYNHHIFPCPSVDCMRTYRNESDLQAHIGSQHLNKTMFKCEKCSLTFARRRLLNQHFKMEKCFDNCKS